MESESQDVFAPFPALNVMEGAESPRVSPSHEQKEHTGLLDFYLFTLIPLPQVLSFPSTLPRQQTRIRHPLLSLPGTSAKYVRKQCLYG